MGFRLASYALVSISAATAAVDSALATPAGTGLPPLDARGPAELFDLVGLDSWLDWSQAFTGSGPAESAKD
jgi:3-hydroxyacyl-CoA dehydrogenase